MKHDVTSARIGAPVLDLIKSQKITPLDVDRLRLDIFPDGILSAEQAVALIMLEKRVSQTCPEWGEYYVTSIADYILCHCMPIGGVSDENTNWLKRVLTRHGLVRTSNEFQLLKSILERAVPASQSFCALVLDQLYQVMLDFADADEPSQGIAAIDDNLLRAKDSLDVLDQLNQSDLFA